MAACHSAGPRLAALTPWVGQPSNVWMYRQFRQLGGQLGTIVTWEYLNRQHFDLPDSEVLVIPPKFAKPLRGWSRTVDALITAKTGGERYGHAFNRWMQVELQKRGIKAVLGQFGHFAMTAEVACRPLGIPVFAHFHGYDMSGRLRKPRYAKSLRSRWHAFAGAIVVARYQRDYLLQQGFDEESIALLPCGAPTDEISTRVAQLRTATPRKDQACRFLFVGRFVEKKDPLSIVKAFHRCFQQQPHSRLCMAGWGPLGDDCREWIGQQSGGFGEAVEFVGKRTPDQVIAEMAAADVLVQHSRVAPDGDMEGWPVVIGEAMAASLPIAATRHAGIVDQVDEGINGFLCDEGDWVQMGDDMARLAADPTLRSKLGQASWEKIRRVDACDQIERLREFINRRTDRWYAERPRRAA